MAVIILDLVEHEIQTSTYNARIPYPTMFTITPFVKALRAPDGRLGISFFIGECARDEGSRGELALVR